MEAPALPLQSSAWVFAVLMAAVLLVPIASERLRIPPVVGLVLGGMLVGPHVLGLLEREGTLALLGSAGLLYLMFMAGLDLDLDEFRAQRAPSALFGALTFAFPMMLGALVSVLMGFAVPAAILLASCWASHTLLAYPVYRRHGTHLHRSVATAVGGTILTDTAALIVLVVVVRAHQGTLDLVFWFTLVPSLTGLAAATLWGLPRLGRWFFAGIGQDRGIRFLFVMVALFASAALARLAGVEAIIGAFLAGVGLNRLIPSGSQLMDRVEFLGSQLLIPIFLVSVGMLVDPRILGDVATLGVAAGFTAVALGGKAAAAVVAGGVLRYDRNEIGTLFSLSAAQAAATLAAIIVGLQVGLIGTETVNAVILVILVTCVLTSWTAGRYAPRLSRPVTRRTLGSVVVVPIARPESVEPLLRLAAAVALVDAGRVVPVRVLGPSATAAELEAARSEAARSQGLADRHGIESSPLVRIDASPAAGVLHTVVELDGTLVVMGWKGHSSRTEALFGGIIDTIVEACGAPVLVARLHERPPRRVLVALPSTPRAADEAAAMRLALVVAARVAAWAHVPVEVIAGTDAPDVLALPRDVLGLEAVHDARRPAVAIRHRATPKDIVIVPGRAEGVGLGGAAERIARAAPNSSVVVAVAGHQGADELAASFRGAATDAPSPAE